MTDFTFFTQLPETLETERLLLRAPVREDVADITRLANNRNIYDMLARLPYPYTAVDAENFVDNIARSASEYAWAIDTRDENFIGTIGLHLEPGKAPELGYWLGEPYWGEGFASEAVAAIVAAADAAGCPALTANVRSANKASLTVLTKSGFVKTGEAVTDCGPHKGVGVIALRRERSR